MSFFIVHNHSAESETSVIEVEGHDESHPVRNADSTGNGLELATRSSSLIRLISFTANAQFPPPKILDFHLNQVLSELVFLLWHRWPPTPNGRSTV